MFGPGVKIGRLAGIPIGIHPLWLLIVGLITWSLGSAYYPDAAPGIAPGLAYALGLASALLLFASILLHELGHALVARRYGVETEEIDLWLLGGVAKLKGSPSLPREEFRYAIAGPAVTLAIFVLFAGISLILPSSTPDSLRALVAYQAFVNGAILVFNLLPAFPLDGGRILRALLWERKQDMTKATVAAAGVGRLFAFGLIGLGILGLLAGAPGVVWLGLIGVFLYFAGQAEERGTRLKEAFGGPGLRRVMAVPAVTIPAEITASEAIRDYFARYGYRGFPVVEGGEPIGLVTIKQVEALPAAGRATTRIGDLADRDPTLRLSDRVTIDELVASPGFQRHGRAIVVRGDGELGIISSTAIQRAMRAEQLLD